MTFQVKVCLYAATKHINDDIVWFAKNKNEMQTTVKKWAIEIRDHGMSMNKQKTKGITVSRIERQEV